MIRMRGLEAGGTVEQVFKGVAGRSYRVNKLFLSDTAGEGATLAIYEDSEQIMKVMAVNNNTQIPSFYLKQGASLKLELSATNDGVYLIGENPVLE